MRGSGRERWEEEMIEEDKGRYAETGPLCSFCENKVVVLMREGVCAAETCAPTTFISP